MSFVRPRVLVSRCLGFEKCRWDGNWVECDFVKGLGEFVDFVTVCPEVEIGLGVPRKPLRLVGRGDDVAMIQHETLKDFSEKMVGFSKNFVDGLGSVHGAILKSRSPSCGSRDAKVYPEIENCSSSGKTSGLFAREFMGKFPDVVFEDEKRLSNLGIRENFLSRVFCVAEFGEVRDENSLEEFHDRWGLFFRSYDKGKSEKLDGILGSGNSFDEMKRKYEEVMLDVFSGGRDEMNCAEVVRDLFLKLVEEKGEKEFFEREFLKFKEGKLRLDELRVLLEDLVARKDREMLGSRFFVSFPEGLVDLEDSGSGSGIHFEKEVD